MSRRGSALPSPSPDDPSVPEQRWKALFGTPAPTRLPTLLAQAVAWREQVLAHGDVSVQVARDLKVAAADALRRRVSTEADLPVVAEPASPVDNVGEIFSSTASAAKIGAPRTGKPARTAPLPPASSQLLPGTRLVKAHGGTNHVVEVEARGFRYQGELFGSLSAIAKHITGTHWNGLLFFGLRKRGTYPAEARRRG